MNYKIAISCGTCTHLYDVADKIWQDLVLLDLLAVLPDLLLHDVLLML